MDLTVKYRRWGGHGTWEGPTDLTVRYRRWGGSWDTGGTWGCGCRI